MFILNLTKHRMKWYCFIQMQLIGTFVHYFVLDCIVISIAAIICSPFVSMAHYRQALFSMTYFSSLVFFCGVCIAHLRHRSNIRIET